MTAVQTQVQPAPLTHDLLDRGAQVAARAFFDDPFTEFLVPDKGRRLARMTPFFRSAFKYGLLYGETYTVPGTADSTALWLAPGKTKMPMRRMLRAGMLLPTIGLGLGGMNRFMGMMNLLEKVHHEKMPGDHWYLMILCTDPPKWGQGLASSVLRPVFSKADSSGLPCYLETFTEKDVQFYTKRGFTTVWEGTIPNKGPHVWTMARNPQR
jgi:GNAT superfamily N-acetyltransferase